jgi:hypothetical protein
MGGNFKAKIVSITIEHNGQNCIVNIEQSGQEEVKL